jgi:ribonuclease HI
MNSKTVDLRQILKLLDLVQEFVNTNPNEVTALVDSALLIEAMYADLNPQDATMPINTSAYAEILRLAETIQEFVDTNPNEVTTLTDSALLVGAMYANLNHPEAALVN